MTSAAEKFLYEKNNLKKNKINKKLSKAACLIWAKIIVGKELSTIFLEQIFKKCLVKNIINIQYQKDLNVLSWTIQESLFFFYQKFKSKFKLC